MPGQCDDHACDHAIYRGMRCVGPTVVTEILYSTCEKGLMKRVVEQDVAPVYDCLHGSVYRVELARRLNTTHPRLCQYDTM